MFLNCSEKSKSFLVPLERNYLETSVFNESSYQYNYNLPEEVKIVPGFHKVSSYLIKKAKR
jgi:hypothetical protein